MPEQRIACALICLDKALWWKELDSEHQILQRGSKKTVDNYKPRKKFTLDCSAILPYRTLSYILPRLTLDCSSTTLLSYTELFSHPTLSYPYHTSSRPTLNCSSILPHLLLQPSSSYTGLSSHPTYALPSYHDKV